MKIATSQFVKSFFRIPQFRKFVVFNIPPNTFAVLCEKLVEKRGGLSWILPVNKRSPHVVRFVDKTEVTGVRLV